jgi:hypothetical protein
MAERARCSRRGCEPVPWVFLATDAPSYMSGPNLLRAKTGRERRDLGDGRGGREERQDRQCRRMDNAEGDVTQRG